MAAEPIPDETTVAPPASEVSPRRARAARWAKLLATFLTGQTLVQGLNVLTGFLLLRWMSVEAYAQYTVANSFQGTIGVLTDLGVSGSIVALVGQRIHDKRVVGEYVRAARAFRGRMFLVMALVAAAAFPLVTKNQPWAWHVKLLLLGGVLTQIFFSAWGMYNAPLLMHRRLADSYRAATVPAFLRLAVSWAFHAAGALTGWLATWINGTMTLVGGWMTRRASRDLIEEPPRADPERTREIVRYLTPLWPMTAFVALQGQLTVFLIALFGSTRAVADIGALGRLGQLIGVLGAANTVILGPAAAACSETRILRLTLVASLAWVLGAVLCVGLIVAEPRLVEWLLGPKYASALPLAWLAATVSFTANLGLAWQAIATSRLLVNMQSGVLLPTLAIALQAIAIPFLDLSKAQSVLFLSLLVWVAYLAVFGVVIVHGLSLRGLSRGTRRT